MKVQKLLYIISDIDKALAFEWVAMNIDQTKFELSFLLLNPSTSNLEQYLSSNGFNVKRIKCAGKRDWPIAWFKIVGYLIGYKPDIVHCHLLQANILGLIAARIVGIPKRIYTRHHSDYHFRYFPKGVKWDRLANKLSTKIIAPSNGVKHILTDLENVPESKIYIINHGFNLNYFRNVPNELKELIKTKYNSGDRHPVVGVISRFTELKGIQYIIPAFEKLLLKYPNALLLMFNAKGDYVETIRELLKALPAKSYKTVPFEPELAAVYSLFDVFVQVSTDTHIEAFGQTYIEALAAGIPSVFTLSGIAPDFIRHHENAIVVPFRDEDGIYYGMLEILENVELCNKIINGGWNSVLDRFSLQGMMYKLNEVYSI